MDVRPEREAAYEYQDVLLDQASSGDWLNLYRECGWELIDIRRSGAATVRLRRNMAAAQYDDWLAQESRRGQQLARQLRGERMTRVFRRLRNKR